MADSRASDGESERQRSLISGRGKNEAMNVLFTDPQILDCYICCERLSIPVFQVRLTSFPLQIVFIVHLDVSDALFFSPVLVFVTLNTVVSLVCVFCCF